MHVCLRTIDACERRRERRRARMAVFSAQQRGMNEARTWVQVVVGPTYRSPEKARVLNIHSLLQCRHLGSRALQRK